MSLPPKSDKKKIPDDYFKHMKTGLFKKLKEEETFEINDHPFLFSIDKDSDYTTPQKYFENFEIPIQKTNIKTIRLKSLIWIAAIGLLVIGLGLLFRLNEPAIQTTMDQEVAELVYLNSTAISELEDIDLMNLLIKSEMELNTNDLNNDELIEYLIQETELEDLNFLQ